MTEGEHNPFGQIAEGVTRAPAPSWVDLEEYIIPEEPDERFMSEGVCYLLDDTQIDLTGVERAWFFRRADFVVTGAGAERAAHFEAIFDPTCERLEIHYVRVRRRDKTFDHTNAPHFDVLRRERNLEQYKFDGRLSAHLAIPDVRAGDIIEAAYTIYGMRPIFAGRHAAIVYFESHTGVLEVRHRLRAPQERTIATRSMLSTPAETQTIDNGVIDRRWRTTKPRRVEFEDGVPPWVVQTAQIQFSEWKDWAEVARAFAPVYEETAPKPAELEAEIANIAQTADDPEIRAMLALNFVQDSIRYHAISMGDGGFVPRPISDIWSTRFGDCKDATKLYLAVARSLGLDACAALVNTFEGHALGEWLPTAHAFDHCVVRLRINGDTHWLDPTSSPQRSKLGDIAQPRFGMALPLTETTNALEDMGEEPFIEGMTSHEIIEFGESPRDAIHYTWRTTYQGWRAEFIRARIDRDGERGLFRAAYESVARIWPDAHASRQAFTEDENGANAVRIDEDYVLSNAWTSPDGKRYATATLDLTMRGQLPKLDPGPRQYPIYLGGLGRISRRVEINARTPWRMQSFHHAIDATALRVETRLTKRSSQSYLLEQTLDVREHALPAAEAPLYHQIIGELENSDIRFESRVLRGKFTGEVGSGLGVRIWFYARILFVFAAATIWAWLATKF